jgi:hypothetical protein
MKIKDEVLTNGSFKMGVQRVSGRTSGQAMCLSGKDILHFLIL